MVRHSPLFRNFFRVFFAFTLAVTTFLQAAPIKTVEAATTLTIIPIGWNVMGLDSNNINVGPNLFPVGARVCNTGGETATNVTSSFIWDSADPYINLRSGSLSAHTGAFSVTELSNVAPNNCTDFYYEVEITRNSAAYDHIRRFHITASADGVGTISTPTPREIYVEHLISQNRNAVSAIEYKLASDSSFTNVPNGGTMFLAIGNTYDIKLYGSTATQGYNQLESFISLPNTLFRVNHVTSTYTAPPATAPNTSDTLYADACGWDNDPYSPSYRSCIVSDDKRGGDVTNTFNVTIISGSGTNQPLSSLLFDFSGSSFHYNSDFSTSARYVSIVDAVNLSKAFRNESGTYYLDFTLVNPTGSDVSGISFIDPLPSSPEQMTVTETTSSTTNCGSATLTATAGSTSITFEDGSVSAGETCTFSVKVTPPTSGVYINTTGELMLYGIGTGQVASANLTVASGSSGDVCIDMAKWTIDSQTTSPPTPSINNVTTAQASSGNGLTTSIDTATQSWKGVGWPKTGPVTYTTAPYFQFTVNTSGYTNADMSLSIKTVTANPNGPTTVELYSSTNGGTSFTKNGSSITGLNDTFQSFGPYTFTTNSSGNTIFRVYAYGSQNTGSGDMWIDNILFHGCITPKSRPTLTKEFSPAAMALGDTSTLTFTLTNPNADTALNGVAFTDPLPSGLQVADPPNTSISGAGCTTPAPTFNPLAGDTTLDFSGGTIPISGSCTVQVDITADSIGSFVNTSGFITANESGGSSNTGLDGVATDTLDVVNNPSIAINFESNPIYVNDTSVLSFTLTNPNSDALTSATFSSLLPAGVSIADTDPVSNTCSGSFSPALVLDGDTISYSGGTIPANGTCVVSVLVKGLTIGDYTTTTDLTATHPLGITLTAPETSDTLAVVAPNPSITLLKQVSDSSNGPWYSYKKVTAGSDIYYRFTIENTGDVELNSLSVSDPTINTASCVWPAALPVADAFDDDHIATCIVGPFTASSTLGTYPNTAKARAVYPATSTVIESNNSTASYALPAPDLLLYKMNSAGGSVTGTSTPFTWYLTVKNSKYGDPATFNYGETILQDDLPAAATYSAGTVTYGTTAPTLTGTATITCSIDVSKVLSCTVGGVSGDTVVLDPDASFTVPITVTPSSGGDLVNPASGGVCKVDPNNVIQENNENNNTATDTVLVNAPGSPDLRVSKSNSTDGEGLVGTPFTWNLTVSNTGTADAVFTSTWAILTDTLPINIEDVSVKVGGYSGITNSDKINCTLSGSPQVLSCIADGSTVTIASGGNFTISITATPTASGSLINSTAQVDPDNHIPESNETNNTATTNTVVASSLDPDLSVSKTNDTSNVGIKDTPFTWTLSVANTGTGPANFDDTEVILTDDLPTGAAYSGLSAVTSNGVTGTINCDLSGSAPYSITCTASGGAVEIGSGGNFQISFSAEPDGSSSLANTATVDPDGNVTESNESNNTGSNTVTLAGVTVSGQVRHDTDGDGALSETPADSGISGVTIRIYTDPNGDGDPADGTVYATTTTAGDGTYSFINVPPDDYVIVETNLSGYTSTGDAEGSNDDQIAVSLVSGSPSTENDFLDAQPASINGTVYNDANSSGDFDAGETGIQNVTVKLYAADVDGNPTGVALQTTTTDADGAYSFTSMMPGKYVVVETDPSGYESTGDTDGDNDNQIVITLTSGSDSSNNNFFDVESSGISGTVWVDTNGDGTKQAGEATGISGVTIDLYTDPNGDGDPADGVKQDTTATDINGDYAFPGIAAGTYVVVQTNLSGYTSTGDKDGGNFDRIAVNLSAGVSSTGNDFLDAQPASISGTVYNDANSSGNFDAGETGIQNVTVKLYAADVDGNPTGVALQTTTTDADGVYSFTSVMPGRYVVVETDPSGFTSTGDTDGDNDNQIVINLTSGNDSTAHDFFDAQNGSVDGTVWVDSNGDGVKQAGETTGISGVTVELYTDPNGDGDPSDGTVFDTQTTDTDGTYSFSDVPPGDYVVVETNLSGYTSTGDKDGGNFDRISVTLSAGDANSGNDFLDTQAGSISGTVYNDANSSGDFDTGETGIQNVTVKLYVADVDGNPTGVALQTTTTDADGAYSFSNVMPGRYVVVETDPSGYDSTGDTDGDNDNQIVINLTSGSDSTAHDFFDAQTSGISGTVWVDSNGDGVKQAGETTGISGVTIDLYSDPNGDGDPADGVKLDTTTTDASGEYSFGSVAAGTYIIVQTNLSGYTSTGDKDGSNFDHIAVNLSAGASSPANDFLDTQPASISGSVIDDANGNGAKDGGETGVQNVTVQLFAADVDGNPTGGALQTTTTDADGNYSFSNLMPGKYVVVETDPTGYASTGDSEGDNDNHIVINLTSGSDSTSNDFLDAQFSSISGAVWLDANGDGIKQAGESTGISGVTIKLYAADSEGKPTGDALHTTLTDLNGEYSFADIEPGDYVIVETNPTGYTSTGDSQGDNDDQIVLTVGVNETLTDNDFLDTIPGSIRGVVWKDDNANGLKDGLEKIFPNVTVKLYAADVDGNPTGDAIATQKTNSNGEYAFTSLPPGDYVVIETDPTGYDSTTPNKVQVTLVSSGSETVDFGDLLISDTSGYGTIKGTVIEDANNNGVQDTGESPLADVTITLYDEDGNVVDTRTTGANGTYVFAGLQPGRYTVVQEDKTGYISTTLNTVHEFLVGKQTVTVDYLDRPLVGAEDVVDPAVTKLGSPANATIGSTVVYTITIGNNGNQDALSVHFTDTKPDFLDILSVQVEPLDGITPVVAGNTISIDFGTITPSMVYTVTVLTRVNALGVPPGGTNTVNITSTSPGDPLFNNDSAALLTIRSSAGGDDDDGDGSDGTGLITSIPATGFAPFVETLLPIQTVDQAYSSSDLVLEIPSLNQSMTIVGVPNDKQGWDVAWLDDHAGYLDGTAYPTFPGNSVLGGHVYLANGLPGPFFNLHQLAWGDQIIIHAYGQDFTYEVRTVETVLPTNVKALLKHEENPWITLFTCKNFDEDSQTYLSRVIVRAVLVSVKSSQGN